MTHDDLSKSFIHKTLIDYQNQNLLQVSSKSTNWYFQFSNFNVLQLLLAIIWILQGLLTESIQFSSTKDN